MISETTDKFLPLPLPACHARMMSGHQKCNKINCYEGSCEEEDDDCHSNFDTMSRQNKTKITQQSTNGINKIIR